MFYANWMSMGEKKYCISGWFLYIKVYENDRIENRKMNVNIGLVSLHFCVVRWYDDECVVILFKYPIII